jgi:hypothetical protein
LKHSNFMIESLFNSFIQVDHQIDQTSFDSWKHLFFIA